MALDLPSYLLGRRSGGSSGALVPIVVEQLPQIGEAGKLYLVPRQTSETNNVFDEYIWVDNDWELIGTAQIDISGKEDKSNKVTSISGSSTNTEYPSALAVYTYITNTLGNISTILETLVTVEESE